MYFSYVLLLFLDWTDLRFAFFNFDYFVNFNWLVLSAVNSFDDSELARRIVFQWDKGMHPGTDLVFSIYFEIGNSSPVLSLFFIN